MPNTRNFFICYSTIFGHFSFLHHYIGSLFVRKLCSTLLDVKCIEKHDICGILIIVVSSSKITLVSEVYCTQMPSFQVNLRKIFNFSLAAKHMFANISTPRLSLGEQIWLLMMNFVYFGPTVFIQMKIRKMYILQMVSIIGNLFAYDIRGSFPTTWNMYFR